VTNPSSEAKSGVLRLDPDLSVSPTHGDQESIVWNGHFGCTCYHPLFLFNIAFRGDSAFAPIAALGDGNMNAQTTPVREKRRNRLAVPRKGGPYGKSRLRR